MKKLLRQIFKFIAIFSITIVLFEVAAFFIIGRSGTNLVDHPVLNHTWRPDSSYMHYEYKTKGEPPYEHVYNKQGWLERYDIAKEKKAGLYRIFYVGDSFIEGTLAMEYSVPSLVEKELSPFFKDRGRELEVINTGTSSYSPLIYYLLIKHKILEFSPDLIVLNVDMTDDFDDWKYRQSAIFSKAGEPVAVSPRDLFKSDFVDTSLGALPATLAVKLAFFLDQQSFVYHLLLALLNSNSNDVFGWLVKNSKLDYLYTRDSWCKTHWDKQTATNVNFTMSILERVINFCQQNNISLILSSVPRYEQYHPEGKRCTSIRPHAEVQSLAEQYDVPYLNSFTALKPYIERAPRERYFYLNDIHFNRAGYRLWADAHISFLKQQLNQQIFE